MPLTTADFRFGSGLTAMHSEISPNALNELRETAARVPPGNFAEVGVYRGGSAAILYAVAQASGRALFLFDTFTGIPHQGPMDHHKVGDFGDVDLASLKAALPAATFCVGVFPDTLVDTGPLALVHVDCDQYASVKACCEAFGPRMVPGGVMVFDDCDVLAGARQALQECFGDRATVSVQGKYRVVF